MKKTFLIIIFVLCYCLSFASGFSGSFNNDELLTWEGDIPADAIIIEIDFGEDYVIFEIDGQWYICDLVEE